MTNISHARPDSVRAAIGLLERDAGAIDRAFGRAGERLSAALEVFDAAIGGLSSISETLLGREMSTTGESLRQIVGDLHAFGRALPEEARSVQSIERLGETGSQSFRAAVE